MKLRIVWFLLLLSGCGYRFNQTPVSVYVPYVEGDEKGEFTQTLIYSISKEPNFFYSSCGNYLLKVCLEAPLQENIGFRYAPPTDEDDQATNVLVSTEARITLKAKVKVLDAATYACVIAPFVVSSSISYDFESDFSNIDFHRFSLGQLEMHDLAERASFRPLYVDLAQKIVDALACSW